MAKTKEKKTYRILSLDGGGIRGLISAVWLKRLQSRLEAPLWQYFDLIAGTSTGAILGCGISRGIEIDQIIDFYVEHGRQVFPGGAARLWSRATRLFSDGSSAPKYDGAGLEAALRKVFGNAVFGDMNVGPTLVTSYDLLGRQSIVFKSTKVEHHSLPVWEVCRASAAAPTYFPAHVTKLDGADVPLIDGGVVANNPAACAIAEGVRINRSRKEADQESFGIEDFLVASLGTGEATRSISISESLEWGALEWALPMIDVLFDGSSDSVHYIASQLIDPENYFRMQLRLEEAYDDLDNADRTNLNALVRLANNYAENQGQSTIKKLAKRLNEAGTCDLE